MIAEETAKGNVACTAPRMVCPRIDLALLPLRTELAPANTAPPKAAPPAFLRKSNGPLIIFPIPSMGFPDARYKDVSIVRSHPLPSIRSLTPSFCAATRFLSSLNSSDFDWSFVLHMVIAT